MAVRGQDRVGENSLMTLEWARRNRDLFAAQDPQNRHLKQSREMLLAVEQDQVGRCSDQDSAVAGVVVIPRPTRHRRRNTEQPLDFDRET